MKLLLNEHNVRTAATLESSLTVARTVVLAKIVVLIGIDSRRRREAVCVKLYEGTSNTLQYPTLA